MEQIAICLSMVQKFTNLKDSELVASPLCLGKISKDWSTDNMKKRGLMDMCMILVLIMVLQMLMIFVSI